MEAKDKLELRVKALEELIAMHIKDAFPNSDVDGHHDDHLSRAKRIEWVASLRDKVIAAVAISISVSVVGWVAMALWMHFLGQVKP